MRKKFEFTKNSVSKKVNIMLRDKFTDEDGQAFIVEYKKVMSTINTKEYSLILDCKMLEIGAKGSAKSLEECFKLYSQDKFIQTIFILNKPQKVLENQFIQLAKKCNLDGFKVEFV